MSTNLEPVESASEIGRTADQPTIKVTPTAIDAHVYIDSIRVLGRYRRALGDVSELANSIRELGLLNPITITGDSRLVAGERRLAACRLLGWDTVPVRIAKNLTEATQLLHAERDENACRLDMLPSEKAALGAALEEIEAVAARERQRAAGRENGRGIASALQGGSYSGHETARAVGEILSVSRSTYGELRFAHKVAEDTSRPAEERALARRALTDMDLGAGVQPTVAALREALANPAEQPATLDRSSGAAEKRRESIREHAERGLTSQQISKKVGISDISVRKIARDYGIRITADETTSRTRHIDPNRVVSEAVYTLDGLAMGVGLVIDDLDGLNVDEAETWADSLTQSVRAINRLIKEIKKRVKEQHQ